MKTIKVWGNINRLIFDEDSNSLKSLIQFDGLVWEKIKERDYYYAIDIFFISLWWQSVHTLVREKKNKKEEKSIEICIILLCSSNFDKYYTKIQHGQINLLWSNR